MSVLADHGRSSHVVGRALLREAALLLAAAGIPVLPLKGIWLQHFVYADPSERPITDVDVLVPEHQYRAARNVLASRGWQLRNENVSEASYATPSLPMPLDLHARLYTRAAFRMRTADLFARARLDTVSFGVAVWSPDPLDVLAHAIGHALKGGGAWSGDGHELVDIPRLAAVFRLAPLACAAHLERLGLARAARFVLPLTAANDADAFGARVLAALVPDALGAALATTANALRTHIDAHAPRQRLSSVAGFALDSSLWRGAFALGLRVWDKQSERGARVLAGTAMSAP